MLSIDQAPALLRALQSETSVQKTVRVIGRVHTKIGIFAGSGLSEYGALPGQSTIDNVDAAIDCIYMVYQFDLCFESTRCAKRPVIDGHLCGERTWSKDGSRFR